MTKLILVSFILLLSVGCSSPGEIRINSLKKPIYIASLGEEGDVVLRGGLLVIV